MGEEWEVPPDPLMVQTISVPAIAVISTSHIMRDEVTGVNYMNTVTTSVGRVAISGPKQGTLAKGLTILDVMDKV